MFGQEDACAREACRLRHFIAHRERTEQCSGSAGHKKCTLSQIDIFLRDCKESRLRADLEKSRHQYTDKEEKEMRERMEFARGSVEGTEGAEGMEDVCSILKGVIDKANKKGMGREEL
jgi:hypothetical protein